MPSQPIKINRPFHNSFKFEGAQFSAVRLEQIHKLSRNFAASLNLGCPNVKHVTSIQPDGSPVVNTALDPFALGPYSDRELYLLWVRQWKVIYNNVSRIIRELKSFRRTSQERFPKLNTTLFQSLNPTPSNSSTISFLNSLSAEQLPRLQETAMVLLNARFNAKLAAGERRRRNLEDLRQDLETLSNQEPDSALLLNIELNSLVGGESFLGLEPRILRDSVLTRPDGSPAVVLNATVEL